MLWVFRVAGVLHKANIFWKRNGSCKGLRKAFIREFHDTQLCILIGTERFREDVHRCLHGVEHDIDIKIMRGVKINFELDIIPIWIVPNVFANFIFSRHKGKEILDWINRAVDAATAPIVYCLAAKFTGRDGNLTFNCTDTRVKVDGIGIARKTCEEVITPCLFIVTLRPFNALT